MYGALYLRIYKRIKLYVLKRDNSKNPLPKPFCNLISKLRKRIESTFNQLIEHFDIKQVRVYSILTLCTMLEIKLLCFKTEIGSSTKTSNALNFN